MNPLRKENNEGSSLTYSAEQIATEVIHHNKVPTSVLWIRHYPPETPLGQEQ